MLAQKQRENCATLHLLTYLACQAFYGSGPITDVLASTICYVLFATANGIEEEKKSIFVFLRRSWSHRSSYSSECNYPSALSSAYFWPFSVANVMRAKFIGQFRAFESSCLIDAARTLSGAQHFEIKFGAFSEFVGSCEVSALRNASWIINFLWRLAVATSPLGFLSQIINSPGNSTISCKALSESTKLNYNFVSRRAILKYFTDALWFKLLLFLIFCVVGWTHCYIAEREPTPDSRNSRNLLGTQGNSKRPCMGEIYNLVSTQESIVQLLLFETILC